MMPFVRLRVGARPAASVLTAALLFLGACSAADDSGRSPATSDESGSQPALSSPVPTPTLVEPVARDDGAGLPPAKFASDLGVDDVTGLANKGTDLPAAEQFALSAMQLLMNSDNSELQDIDLDEIVSDDVKNFVRHANAGVEDLGIDQEFLVKEAGWVRSQWIDESEGSARSQFLVRHRYEIGASQTEYWADVRVDLQRANDRWQVVEFMFAPGPREKVLDKELKQIYMQDESTWRPVSALK